MPVTPPPSPPQPAPPLSPADLRREYVAGGRYAWDGRSARALPWAIDDDVSRDFGDDIWDRMVLDSQVSACLSILKASILEDGVKVATALDDEAEPDYALAREIRDEAEAMLDDLDIALPDVLWDLLNALAYGNMLAEQVYDLRPGIAGRVMLQLKALKVKPRRATAFVVDAYFNVIGIFGAKPGMANALWSGVVLNAADTPDLLPREKFAVLTFRPKDGDPRGTSILRAAFDPWWRKRQVHLELLKFLTQFAGPSIWGTTAEKATSGRPMYDDAGNVVTAAVTPEEALLAAILNLQNGTAVALPYGNELHLIQSTGEGRAFFAAIAQCDQQITKAMLTQELATEQGEHQARAAAQVHQDVLDTLVRQGKQAVVRMLTRDVLQPWVRYNWGERAEKLVPKVTLGTTEQRDIAGMWNAAANLFKSGFPADEQLPAIDQEIGLPARDMEAWTAQQAPVAAPNPAADAQDQPIPPADGGPAGSPPSGGAPAAPAQQPTVPPNRVAVRGHERNRPPPRKPADAAQMAAEDLAAITEDDILMARRFWRRHSPATLRELVDAEVVA